MRRCLAARSSFRTLRVRPLRGNEPAVPRQDGVRCDDGRDRIEDFPAQRFPFGRQSTTLVVGEAQAPPTRLELFFEDSVLFDKVVNHGRLSAANPAGERGQEELKMNGFSHAGSVSGGPQLVT